MHNLKIESLIRKLLYVIELILAVLTIIVLVGNLGIEAYRVVIDPTYFPTSDLFLKDILSIVVGLEFVRMLIDLTPANVLEVVTVAIARHIILSHDDPISLLAGVLALAAMFATRRYLISRKIMHMELSNAFSDNDDNNRDL